ncbi:MAG: hypothetical protein ABFD54_17440 [Armatimonadota bacterium]|nr:hypothetical protein [bacterium]
MVGLKRHKRIEGWAVEVPDADSELGQLTPIQRLAENNRLWVFSLAGVLVLAILLMFIFKHSAKPADPYGVRPSYANKGYYDDQQHRLFAQEFAVNKSYGSAVIEANFVSLDRFKIVLDGNCSADEIDYAAKMAAMLILRKFRYRAVVQCYVRRASDGVEHLAATTIWSPKKYGFVVKFENSNAQMTN